MGGYISSQMHHMNERLEHLKKAIKKTIYGEEKTPYKANFFGRLLSILVIHFRGLIGFVILIFANCMTGSQEQPNMTVYCMWITMALFFVFQPVNIPITGMIPIFYLPMLGIMSSNAVCKCYFGTGQALFLLGSMIGMLINNSKFDRRFIVMVMNPSKPCGPKLMLFKASFAAYFMSIFSNKLLVTSYMMQVLAPAFSKGDTKFKNILMNAIQTSSTIGGLAFIHGSLNVLTMKTIFDELTGGDVFNYFNYLSVIPLTISMFVVNFLYHVVLVKAGKVGNLNTEVSRSITEVLSTAKAELPIKVTAHEIQTILFYLLALLMFISRATPYGGWEKQFSHAPDDPVVGAFFVILLSVLPKGCSFIKVFLARTKSEMPPCKPESAIMFWKFIDKNINYGYLFLIGGCNALAVAVDRMLSKEIADGFAGDIFGYSHPVSVLIIVGVVVCLVNIMSGVAALGVVLTFIAAVYSKVDKYKYFSTVALTAGIASSLGFACPFKFTCAYFFHYVGKVPKKSMFLMGFGSAIVCAIPLLVFMIFNAPLVFLSPIPEAPPTMPPPPPPPVPVVSETTTPATPDTPTTSATSALPT